MAWIKPPRGVFKLNVHGARRRQSGQIGAGRVLGDGNGDWVEGFTSRLGIGHVLEAQAWGSGWLLHMGFNYFSLNQIQLC